MALSVVAALVLFGRTAHADAEPSSDDAAVFRLFVQPPLAGFTFTGGHSPTTNVQANLAAGSVALELRKQLAIEAGGGALIAWLGGEVGIPTNAVGWVRAGWTPVIHRSPSRRRGWELQFVSLIGYRYMRRSQIVYEDYGVDVESIHAIAVDGGFMATCWSEAAGFTLRVLTGAVVPFSRRHSSNRTVFDGGQPHITFAVPIGLDLGVAW